MSRSEYEWWPKNKTCNSIQSKNDYVLTFCEIDIKKWLYEQVLCLPLCQSQTVPTSPLTSTAPVRVRGNTLKNRQSNARKDEKRDDAGAARAPSACTAVAVHRRGTGRHAGVPALAQAATVGPLHSPGLGERKAEKKMTEKMYVNAPRLQAQCRPCTPQCTPMQGPALPMRRECKRRL